MYFDSGETIYEIVGFKYSRYGYDLQRMLLAVRGFGIANDNMIIYFNDYEFINRWNDEN